MQRVSAITHILDEKKAEDIKVIDMRGKDYFVNFVIIATSLGQKHSLALIEDLQNMLKHEEFLRIENGEEWSVLDLGDIVIHIFDEKLRKIYKIEDLLDELKKTPPTPE